MFESQLIKTDVTVVKLVKTYILAGIGNFLHIFDTNGKFLEKLQIFNGHKIHGIAIEETNFLLYGGCFMQTLECHLDSLQVKFLCNKQIHDWILTGQWLRDELLAVVVMKNVLLLFDKDLTVQRQISCDEKCILYSAFISYDNVDELVVFSGTVFSDILIWKASQTEDKNTSPVLRKLKGHKGVIFSVNYNPNVGYICSSSDDRSSILWSVQSKCIHAELNRTTPEINLTRKFYGHDSRVFRSIVLDHVLVTGGEDSVVNVWNFQGELLNKIATHQGGSVWTFDCRNDMIVSGGGACGILLASITCNNSCQQLTLPDNEIPKNIGFVRESNVIVVTENGALYSDHGDPTGKLTKINQHEDLRSYCLIEISKCRSLFALAGFHGEIYIYQVRKSAISPLVAFKTEQKLRICSTHWLTCQTLFTCGENGILDLWYLQECHPILITTFHLPRKENKALWTTAACQGPNGKYVVGDRRGNIFVYELKNTAPIQVIKKAHNYLGITQLYNSGQRMLSLGRDGNLKTYLWSDEGVETFSADKVPFSWLAALTPENLLLAFSGNSFVVWDYKSRRKLMEHACGGGHRSWGFRKMYDYATLVFVKDRSIHRIKWSEKLSVDVVSDYHFSTINSVAVVPFKNKFLLLSGSEDTNFRISMVGKDGFQSVNSFKSHLSNLKTVCVQRLSDYRYLVFTGGGRGQIICWTLFFDEKSDVECRQEYSHYEATNRGVFESEIRIMDLKVTETKSGRLLLYAAASDGNVDVFLVQKTAKDKYCLRLRNKLFFKVKCVTKICLLKRVLSDVCILVAMSTDGTFTFWNVSRILEDDVFVPLQVVAVHQSAVTTCEFRFINDSTLLLVSGGDDSCVVVSLFKIEADAVNRVDEFRDAFSHCAQVTGAWINADYILTTSVDQKLVVFKWNVDRDRLRCNYRSRYDSAVADIQGMESEEDDNYFHVFLYGKGLEYLKIVKKKL